MTQKKQEKKAELICIGDYSLEFRSWYKNGKLKKIVSPKIYIQIGRLAQKLENLCFVKKKKKASGIL